MTPFSRRPALLLCLLALWLQMLAPALALGMQARAFDPATTICHGGASGGEGERHAPHPPSCDHCLACHAAIGDLPREGTPPFTVFDYPVASPLRWAALIDGAPPVHLGRTSRPRGPPLPV